METYRITIAYITCRKEPKFQWFLDSLIRQKVTGVISQVIVVDFWKDERGKLLPPLFDTPAWCSGKDNYPFHADSNIEFTHVAPLPSAIQGSERLTSINWFSASNARNTATVYCKSDYIFLLDDLSIMNDGFFVGAIEAFEKKQCVLCAYEKRNKMIVENGSLISSEELPNGKDNRLSFIKSNKTKAYGSWWYGNCGLPLEYILKLNGWDNINDCLGAEDTAFGIRLSRVTGEIYYDTRMVMVESDELHFVEGNQFKRDSFPVSKEYYFDMLSKFGISERPERADDKYDAVWFTLDLLRRYNEQFTSFGNTYNLRELRNKVLNGGEITVADMMLKDNFWWLNKPFSEM